MGWAQMGIVVGPNGMGQIGMRPIVIVFEYIVITIMNYAGVEALIFCSASKEIYDYSDLALSLIHI